MCATVGFGRLGETFFYFSFLVFPSFRSNPFCVSPLIGAHRFIQLCDFRCWSKNKPFLWCNVLDPEKRDETMPPHTRGHKTQSVSICSLPHGLPGVSIHSHHARALSLSLLEVSRPKSQYFIYLFFLSPVYGHMVVCRFVISIGMPCQWAKSRIFPESVREEGKVK